MPGSDRPTPPPAWSVVRVPFPYTGRPVLQRRPGLVVWVHEGPGRFDLAWVLMITSAENRGWTGDVAVSELGCAGLPAPSIVRTAKIATVEAGHVEPLGTLAADDRAAVAAALVGRLPV